MNNDHTNAEAIRKELRRLSRTELLELMVEQSRELENTRRELAAAREEIAAKDEALSDNTAQITKLEQQLNNRRVRLDHAGSIAEASLALTGIFEEAQKAAEIYLQNVRVMTGYAEDDPEPDTVSVEEIPEEPEQSFTVQISEDAAADMDETEPTEESDEAVYEEAQPDSSEAADEVSEESVDLPDEVTELADPKEEHIRRRHGRKSRAHK